MNAKQRWYEQTAEKRQKHPIFSKRLISFGLGMAFLGIAIVLIGIIHAMSSSSTWTAGLGGLILSLFMIVSLQGAVVCTAFSINSSDYNIHCISATGLAIALGLDVALAIYYAIIL